MDMWKLKEGYEEMKKDQKRKKEMTKIKKEII